MVRLRKPRVGGSRERLAHSRANEKPIPPRVGKIRLGPQRRRTGALPDAGALHDRPFGRAALRRAGGTAVGATGNEPSRSLAWRGIWLGEG